MRLADYIVKFIEKQGVNNIFLVSGGGIMHLLDAVSNSEHLKYICNHHEQACAIAAEGYQRVTNNIGVAMATTGPGGTNLITGAVCAWHDSIPVLFITGQVNSKTLIRGGMRQYGVQEADIISMVSPLTKYAVTILKKEEIKYHLEKALFLARNGRPGPVWLDVPINLQAAEIEPEKLIGFDPRKEYPEIFKLNQIQEKDIENVVELLKKAKRPLLICGHGIRLANAKEEFKKFVKETGIPVVSAKNGYDILPYSTPGFLGMGGINGYRSANFALQSSDLILNIGCRMSLPFTGYAPEIFAPLAKKIVVDVDEPMLKHSQIKIDIPIKADAKQFLIELNRKLIGQLGTKEWVVKCAHWKQKYGGNRKDYKNGKDFVNSYYFIDYLFEKLADNAIVILDQGAAFYGPTQIAKVRNKQRLFTNGGIAPMGYGLPAALGACVAANREVICIHGDGGLQLNIHELQTIVHYKMPIKLFVFNNQGYLSIKHTMNRFFGKYVACDPSSGVSIPDTCKIAMAYGLPFERISNQQELEEKLSTILSKIGPLVIEVVMDPKQEYAPKVQSEKQADGTMVSKPLSDMYPYLSREEYENEMEIAKSNEDKKNANNFGGL